MRRHPQNGPHFFFSAFSRLLDATLTQVPTSPNKSPKVPISPTKSQKVSKSLKKSRAQKIISRKKCAQCLGKCTVVQQNDIRHPSAALGCTLGQKNRPSGAARPRADFLPSSAPSGLHWGDGNSYAGFRSLRQAAKDARRRVLSPETGAGPPFAAFEACVKRPTTCAVGFWAPKTVQGRVCRISKPAASGRKRGPLDSGPRKRSVAAFRGLPHMRQASENVGRWVLSSENGAGPRLPTFEACAKWPKARVVGFWAPKTVQGRVCRISKPAPSGQRRAPTCSEP